MHGEDIIEELLDLSMEFQPESLWWTSTQQAEEKRDIEGGEQRPCVGPSIKKRVRSLGIPFQSRGEGGLEEQIERCAKVWPVGGEIDAFPGQIVCPCKRDVG